MLYIARVQTSQCTHAPPKDSVSCIFELPSSVGYFFFYEANFWVFWCILIISVEKMALQVQVLELAVFFHGDKESLLHVFDVCD